MAVRDYGLQAVSCTFAEIVEPTKCRRAAPWHEDGDRTFAAAEIEPFECTFDRSRYGGGIDRILAERETRRDNGHIAQRQRFQRPHENGRARYLHGVLRGAYHRGANAGLRPRELRSPIRESCAHLGGELRAAEV